MVTPGTCHQDLGIPRAPFAVGGSQPRPFALKIVILWEDKAASRPIPSDPAPQYMSDGNLLLAPLGFYTESVPK
jgi:hypothetical protein